MAESWYVRNGAVAGLVSGVVTAIIVYATLPSPEAVIEEVERRGMLGVGEVSVEYISLALKLSGVIVAVIITLLGVVFGGLHEYLDSKFKMGSPYTAVMAGLAFTGLLVIPNLLFGGDASKIATNAFSGIVYTVVLALLAKYWRGPDNLKYASERY